jgi:hypothetical protein
MPLRRLISCIPVKVPILRFCKRASGWSGSSKSLCPYVSVRGRQATYRAARRTPSFPQENFSRPSTFWLALARYKVEADLNAYPDLWIYGQRKF